MSICKKKAKARCMRSRPVSMWAVFRHPPGENPRGKVRGILRLGRKKAYVVGFMAMQGKRFCIKAAGCFMKTKKTKKCC